MNSQLSPDMFRSITRSLTQKLDKVTEKRTELRVGFRARVILFPYFDEHLEKPIPAWCRDLSEKGIGLMTDAPMKTGRQFILSLDGGDGDRLCLMYSVYRCERQPSGPCLIGARLLKEVGAAYFDALQAAPTPVAPTKQARVLPRPAPPLRQRPPVTPSPGLTTAAVAAESSAPSDTMASPDRQTGARDAEAEVERIRKSMLQDGSGA